jgi:hypothetical protein
MGTTNKGVRTVLLKRIGMWVGVIVGLWNVSSFPSSLPFLYLLPLLTLVPTGLLSLCSLEILVLARGVNNSLNTTKGKEGVDPREGGKVRTIPSSVSRPLYPFLLERERPCSFLLLASFFFSL